MKITPEESIIFFGNYDGEISKVLNGIRPAMIDKIAVNMHRRLLEINEYQKKQLEEKEQDEKKVEEVSYTVKEAAIILKACEKTVRTWAKDKKIHCTKIGKTIRFSKSDLKVFGLLNIGDKYAQCIQSNINIDEESNELLPFMKGGLYQIVYENSTWIKLYNERWDDTARFSKDEFKKYFKIEQFILREVDKDLNKLNIEDIIVDSDNLDFMNDKSFIEN